MNSQNFITIHVGVSGGHTVTLPKLQTKSKPPLPLVFYHLSFLFLEHRLTGPVWIELIVTETKNWKYYSKIIFKWVNSTVGSIFNIFFINKVVVGPINSTATVLLQYHYSIICPLLYAKRVKWKKKKKNEETQMPDASFSRIQTAPESLISLHKYK